VFISEYCRVILLAPAIPRLKGDGASVAERSKTGEKPIEIALRGRLFALPQPRQPPLAISVGEARVERDGPIVLKWPISVRIVAMGHDSPL
jgi:hypothetical protein